MTTAIGFFIILAGIIGQNGYWVMDINRLHSLRIDYRLLKVTRKIHDLAVLAYPVWLVWQAGICDQGLLTGSRFVDQPAWIRWTIACTIPGVVPWLLGMLRWQLKHKHAFKKSDHSNKVNLLSSKTLPPPVGNVKGDRWHVSRLFPLNEIYHLDVNQKSVIVSRSSKRPKSKQPLNDASNSTSNIIRVVHFSDVHFVGCPGEGYYRWLFDQAAAMKPDAFAFTGDLIDDPSLLPLACELLGNLVHVAPCFFVLGNHDWRYDFDSIRQQIIETGWIDVAGRSLSVELNGHQVVVSGNELPWLGTAPPSVAETSTSLRLLLSHSPDQLRFARSNGYDVMLAGHTHGGQVVLPIVGPVFSPSIHGVRYASGLFELDGLQLHVSRGVGGKDPLRWRCPPELTCLHIHLQ